MNYRKVFIMGLVGTLFVQPFHGAFASEIQVSEVQNDTVLDLRQESSRDIVETIEVLRKDEWLSDTQRLEMMVGEQTLLTSDLLAEMICYKLGLSPLYNEQEKSYIERLRKEGLWREGLGTSVPVTEEDYAVVMEQVARYTVKRAQSPFFKQVPAGFLSSSSLELKQGENKYTLYSLGDVNYISLSELGMMGFNSYEEEGSLKLTYEYLGEQLAGLNEGKTKGLQGRIATYNEQKVYIGNVLTYSLKCEDEVLVPIRSIGEYFDINVEGKLCTVVPKVKGATQLVSLTPGKVTNVSKEVLDIEVVSLFWDGQVLLEETLSILGLQPGEVYPLHEGIYDLNKDMLHTSTMVKTILTENETSSASYKNYGQHTKEVLKNYNMNSKKDIDSFLESFFPTTQIIGTMKYSTHGLKKGEKVIVWAAEDGQSHHVIKNDKKITVPWGSVSIPPSPKAHKDQVSEEVVEVYFNSLNKVSKTPYYIWTDLYRQKTYVFERKNEKWQLIRTMLTSTGMNKTPTPTGEFRVNAYVPAFGMNKGYQCKTALHLFGDYLYHSVLFDVKGKYVISGLDRLGERASHGCLRLSPEDSKWLYETMPLGTSVMIR